jgi:ABC-type molybdate transport system substrate-binding protein
MIGAETVRTDGPRSILRLVAIGVAMCCVSPAHVRQAADAGDLKVFTTRAVATVLESMRGDVERRIGRTLTVTTDIAIRLVRRVKAGEPFDVLVGAPGQLDQLIAEGTIVRETRTDIAHAKQLLQLLREPAAAAVMRSQGLEPGGESH